MTGEISANTSGLVRWPVWAALPVSFALLLLQGWSELIKRIAFLRGQGPDPMGRVAQAQDAQALAEALRAGQEAQQAQEAAGAAADSSTTNGNSGKSGS